MKHAWTFAAVAMALVSQEPVMAEPAGHVTGIGGVFFKSDNPKALAEVVCAMSWD